MKRRMFFILIAGIILVAVALGFYWYSGYLPKRPRIPLVY